VKPPDVIEHNLKPVKYEIQDDHKNKHHIIQRPCATFTSSEGVYVWTTLMACLLCLSESLR